MPPRHFLPSAGGDGEDGKPTGKTFKSVKWKWLQEYEKERELEEQRAREAQEKQQREEAGRRAREDAEREAREQAESTARAEAEARAREAAELAAREEAQREQEREREREEAEKRARMEAERRAQEAAARRAREDAERKVAEDKARRALPAAARGPLPLDDDDDLVVLSRPEPARVEGPRKAAASQPAAAVRAAARRQAPGHASSSSHGEPARKGTLPAPQEPGRLRGRIPGDGPAAEGAPPVTSAADTAGEAGPSERDAQWGGPPDGGKVRARLPSRVEQLARPTSRALDEDPSRSNQQDSTATKAGTPQRAPGQSSHQPGHPPADAELADSDEEETLMFSRRGAHRRTHPPLSTSDHSPSRKVQRRDAGASTRRMVVEDVQSSEELPPTKHAQLPRAGSQQGSKSHRGGDMHGRHGGGSRAAHERTKDLGKSNLGRVAAVEACTTAAGSSVLPPSTCEPRVKQEINADGGTGGVAAYQDSAAFTPKPSPDNDGSVGRATKRTRAEGSIAADGATVRPNSSWESKQQANIKVEAEATSSQAGHSIATVECYLEDGSSYNSREVDMTWMQNFKDLWQGLRRVFPSTLPDKLHAKLVYLDHDGDWIMVYPEHTRWSTFRADATKIMVSRKT